MMTTNEGDVFSIDDDEGSLPSLAKPKAVQTTTTTTDTNSVSPSVTTTAAEFPSVTKPTMTTATTSNKITIHMEDLLSPLAKPSTASSAYPHPGSNSTINNGLFSPTEATVAETPSPTTNNNNIVGSGQSPPTVQVKRLIETPTTTEEENNGGGVTLVSRKKEPAELPTPTNLAVIEDDNDELMLSPSLINESTTPTTQSSVLLSSSSAAMTTPSMDVKDSNNINNQQNSAAHRPVVEPFDESPSVSPPKPFDENFDEVWNQVVDKRSTTTPQPSSSSFSVAKSLPNQQHHWKSNVGRDVSNIINNNNHGSADAPDDECDPLMKMKSSSTSSSASKNNNQFTARNHHQQQDRKEHLNYVLSRMMQDVPTSPEERQEMNQTRQRHSLPTQQQQRRSMIDRVDMFTGMAVTGPAVSLSSTSSLAMIASTIQPTKEASADDERLQKLQELSALISEPGEEEEAEEDDIDESYYVDENNKEIHRNNNNVNRSYDGPVVQMKTPCTPPPAVEITSARSNRTYGPDSPGTPPADLPSLSTSMNTMTSITMEATGTGSVVATPQPTRSGMPSTPGTSPIAPATPSALIDEDDSVYIDDSPLVVLQERRSINNSSSINRETTRAGGSANVTPVVLANGTTSSYSASRSDDSGGDDDQMLKPKSLNFSTIKKVAKTILDDSDEDEPMVASSYHHNSSNLIDLHSVTRGEDTNVRTTPVDEPGVCSPPKWEDQDLGSVASSNDDDVPFDCENDYSVLLDGQDDPMDLERGFHSLPEPEPAKKRRNFSFRGMFRKDHHPWAKELDGASNVVPDEVIDNILSCRQQQSASPAELIETYRRRKGETFEDEPLGSVGLAGGANMSFESCGYRPTFPLRQSPTKKKKYFVKRKIYKEEPFEEPVAKGRNWTITCLYVSILLVLVACATLAGLFLTDSTPTTTSPAVENTFDEAQTVAPTSESSGSNLYEGDEVLACQNAFPLVDMDRTYYGSNWKAFKDESLNGCGDLLSIGHAVWYSFTTPFSRLVEASTCNDADFDTKITVMSGTCNELSCVTFNDEYCGHQSKVRWYAQRGITYYVMVHGHRDASGTFGLTMKESHPHDDCYEATAATAGSIVVGTTAGSHSSVPPKCGDVDTSVPGVWYSMDEMSGYQRAELLQAQNEFYGQVAVYRSLDEAGVGCGALICDKGSASGQVSWLAESKHTYYVFVTGENATTDGEFELFLGPDYAHSCEMATNVDPNSIGFLASTQLATPQNVESCGYRGYHTAPGVWFEVVGTGEVLAISTCGSPDDLETEISVFSGGCDGLQCVGGTGQDLPCGPNGEVSFDSVEGMTYHIYISGRGNRKGDFVLNLSERLRYDGYSCNASLPLDLGFTSFQSETTFAPSESVNVCPGYESVRGVWHSFVGTGKTMKLSTCNEDTQFEAIVSIFTGDCNGLSCVAHTTTTCGPNDEVLVTTHVGVVYYVLIHGPDSFSVGQYRLNVDEAPINDSCELAAEIDVANAKYHGSTLSANTSSTLECAGGPAETNGLFYKFIGNGEALTFSTCNNATDFDTAITVFSGNDCSQLTCVANDDDVCGKQSSVSFPSDANETYYVRVGGGNSDDDIGNFVLDVTVGSPFFNA